MLGQQGAGFPGPDPAGVHQREKRRGLPRPRGPGFKVCGGGEERPDLDPGEQVGVRGDDGGLPPVRQHVGLGVSVRLEPPSEIADVRHPGAVTARSGQLIGHPSLDGVAVEG